MTLHTKNKDTQVFLMQKSIEYIQEWFQNMDKIRWITYKVDMPEFIYDILNQKLVYFSTQKRLQNISEKTWIEVWELRKLLRDYTISELEKCRINKGVIIVGECIDDKKNFTWPGEFSIN